MRKRENMRGKKDRHEAFPKMSCSTKTRPVGALLHQMLPKQPFIRRDGENKKHRKK